MRLDTEHYIPRHRRWECRKGSRLRSGESFSQGMAGRRDKLRGFARGHESRLRMDENPSISPSSENRFVEVCGAGLEEGVKKISSEGFGLISG